MPAVSFGRHPCDNTLRSSMNIPVVRVIDRRIGIPLCRVLSWMLGRRRPASAHGTPRRILVMRSFGVGNLALMLPALQALRERYPAAQIDAVTLDANRGFLERMQYFTTVWYLRDRSILGFCSSVARAYPRLFAARYDVFIDFEQFARTSAILGALLMIPRRIGFATAGQGREAAFTDVVPYRNDLHMMDGYYSLLGPLGLPTPEGVAPVPVPTTADEERGADRVLADAGISAGERFVILHPGTGPNFIFRRWPEEYYARVADYLAGQGFRVVLTGVRAEADIVARVVRSMTQPAYNAVGRLSLGELLAVLRRAALVLSNDTGPIHLAAVQGAPVIGLYGPNTPTLYGPRGRYGLAFYLGLPCSPCITNFNEKGSNCRDNLCLKLMSADQVIASLSRMFAGVACEPTATGGVRPIPDAPPVHPLIVRRAAADAEPMRQAVYKGGAG
jgi:heptosyltransferase-3